MDDVNELIQQLQQYTSNPPDFFLGKLLKALRSSQLRRPTIVAKYGPMYLRSRLAKDNDIWILHEQIFTAALDVGDMELAKKCLDPLMQQFPKSPRVKLLSSMLSEANGKFGVALIEYDEILAEHPANIFAMKRKVCVHKAQGNLQAVVSQLNQILSIFQSDTSSWLELAEVYISISDYSSAAFCLEELVLLSPSTPAYHIRLAEAYYTTGGPDGLMKARKHYTLARSLQHDSAVSLRTLYGLIATCNALLANKRHVSSSDGPVTRALLQTTLEEIATRVQSTVAKDAKSSGESSQLETILSALQNVPE